MNDLPLEDGKVLGGWTLGDEQDSIKFCPFCGCALTAPPTQPSEIEPVEVAGRCMVGTKHFDDRCLPAVLAELQRRRSAS